MPEFRAVIPERIHTSALGLRRRWQVGHKRDPEHTQHVKLARPPDLLRGRFPLASCPFKLRVLQNDELHLVLLPVAASSQDSSRSSPEIRRRRTDVVNMVESANRMSPARLPFGGIQRNILNSRFPCFRERMRMRQINRLSGQNMNGTWCLRSSAHSEASEDGS